MDVDQANKTGSNLAESIPEMPELMGGPGQTGAAGQAGLSGESYSEFYTWRANGEFHAVRFSDARMRADSRVFVNISEFSTDAQHRFIGAARMAVYNIAPFDGGFFAWVEISWGSPLNVRFDVLVDP